jgi:hypothetical protein
MNISMQSLRLLSRPALPVSLLLCAASRALAQDSITSDRPGVGISTSTVGPNRFQLEFGLPTVTLVRGDGVDLRAWSTPFLARYGLGESAEVRLSGTGWNDVEDESAGNSVDGFGDLELGGKFNFTHGDGASPSLALVGGVRFPTGKHEFSSGEAGYDLTLAAGWSLPANSSLGATLGAFRVPVGADYSASGVLTTTYGHALTESWSAYGELGWFPDLHNSSDQAVWGLGTTYLLSHDVQLDLWGDFALNQETPDAAFGLGVSVRF